MFMVGQYDIVIGKKFGQAPVLIAAHMPGHDPVRTETYDPNRVAMGARVIETLWSLVNRGEKHPLHDELMAAVKEEITRWPHG